MTNWIKASMLTLCGVLMSTTCCTAYYIDDQSQFSNKLIQKEFESTPIVLSKIVDQEQNVQFGAVCSGVWLSEHDILTAFHCVEDADLSYEERMLYELFDILPTSELLLGRTVHYLNESDVDMRSPSRKFKKSRTSRIIAVSKDYDLAIVRDDSSSGEDHSFAQLSTHAPQIGEQLFTVGHTLGSTYVYAQISVSALRFMSTLSSDIDIEIIQISGDFGPGNSGGAAFDTEGHIMGISSFMSRDRAHGAGFLIHVNTIREFLKTANFLEP